MSVPSKRVAYLDGLRVLAIFAVVVVHVAGTGWASFPVESLRWQTLNVFDGAARFATPVLVMISGYVFLDPSRPVTVRSMVAGRLPRIAIAFVAWSLAYALLRAVTEPPPDPPVWDAYLTYVLTGHYHLWFLGVIAGLYLVTPLLRPVAADPQLSRYFLLLALVFGSVAPLLHTLGWWRDSILAPDRLQLFMVLGYPGYYLLGHHLGRLPLSIRAARAIYAAGLAGLLVTVVGTSLWSLATSTGQDALYFRLNPHVALMSAAVFVAFRRHLATPGPRLALVLEHLSERAFGIFLVHVMFLTIFRDILPLARIPAIVLVPLLSVVVFGLSWAASELLSRFEFARGRIV